MQANVEGMRAALVAVNPHEVRSAGCESAEHRRDTIFAVANKGAETVAIVPAEHFISQVEIISKYRVVQPNGQPMGRLRGDK